MRSEAKREGKKITCHYFEEETGTFLYSREEIPGVDDWCDNCGDSLAEGTDCSKGSHYWVKMV
jgi:hypothetical protein